MNGDIQQALTAAVLRILRPLVRILLRNGVAYGAFAELARKTYVDVADRHFPAPGGRQTVSRIAVLTGLTRKEARRLRELAGPQDAASAERYHRAVRVLSGWCHDARYRDARGRPRELPMADAEPSFAALVKDYSGDMPTQAMFTVLHDAGCIEAQDGRVRLLRPAYIPGGDPVDKLHILGADAAELIATIDHNLRAAAPDLRFQRKVSHDDLPESALPAFRRLSADRAQALLEEFDRWLIEQAQHETGPGEGEPRRYVSVGIYYFEGPRTPGEDT